MHKTPTASIRPKQTLNVKFLPNISSIGVWFIVMLFLPAFTVGQSFSPDDVVFFERRVRTVLIERCAKCHGAKKQESGLRLDSRTAILKGGDSGPAAQVGIPESSLLIKAVRRSGDFEMPPDKPLNPAEVDALMKWVKLGLPWPKEVTPSNSAAVEADSHWAFQPVVRPSIPKGERGDWSKSDVDRFVIARLDQAGLSPAAEATARALIRRATFDLTGLPPTAEEVARFKAEYATTPDGTYRRLIDQLLDSPHYGERQGRHWLDVARYADNKGYVFFE